MMAATLAHGKKKIYAKVRRASTGEVIDLGQVNARFPWRLWLYRWRCYREGTHCLRGGHALVEGNLTIDSKGRERCLACHQLKEGK